MRAAIFLALPVFTLYGYAGGPRSSLDRLSEGHLEAAHAQRIEWKKNRAPYVEPEGVYRDFRTVILKSPAVSIPPGIHAVFGGGATGNRNGMLFLDKPEFEGISVFGADPPAGKDWEKRASRYRKQYPDEVVGSGLGDHPEQLARWDAALAASETTAYGETPASAIGAITTHILAPRLTPEDLQTSLKQGHAYVAYEWLADPTGFLFHANNNIGTFEMGDMVDYGVLYGPTIIEASVPIPARLRLLRNGELVAETRDTKLAYTVDREGAYRLEAALTIDGEERPWIFSNALYIRRPWDIRLPSSAVPESVQVLPDITYVNGSADDKQKLDLYLPKGKQNFPVLIFYHGGAWRVGDRSLYRALGARLARAGIGVAIPSYRLMGVTANAHPAQVEDAAAAFSWVIRNIGEHGGDVARIYLAGHSSGGHMASLLALDGKYLQVHGLDPASIRGVISMSGVYNVDRLLTFRAEGEKRDASPMRHVHRDAPRFLIAYCQWDYLGLPKQAREFSDELKKAFVGAQLLYIPRENHLSEIINLTKEQGPLINAVLEFVQ